MIHFLILGTILGLSAGFAPGPLLTLVISETMRHGKASGIKVSLAPVVTDLPIIIVSLFVLSKLSDSQDILGFISLVGGAFVFYMGCENFKAKPLAPEQLDSEPRSLAKGILVNFLSPHPYLFWMSVGAPLVVKASRIDRYAPVLFIACFYIMLVGSKIFLAVLTGRSRSFLTGRKYIITMRFLGVALCGLALLLIRDGLRFLGMSGLF